jgi:glycolate oxidase
MGLVAHGSEGKENLIGQSLIKELTKIVGRDNILSEMKDRIAYSYDATLRQAMPDVIVFPRSTADVSAIMKVAHREKIPVVPRGAGTNLSGGTVWLFLPP